MTDSPPEVWLRTNRRALALGMILPLSIVAVGGGVAIAGWWLQLNFMVPLLGALIAFGGLFLLGTLAYGMSVPRLGYKEGELLLFLDARQPVGIPIDVVECFFLGQGESTLPKIAGREPETSNVIVRLAESATDWKHRDVNPRFAHWCESYITLSGAWCEPIDGEALKRLNQRLVEVQRERKARQKAIAPPSHAQGGK